MLRRLLLLAPCVSPAIAIECDKCAVKECFETCFYLQKVRSTEAKYKCCSASADGVAQCFMDDKACDGSAAGVDQCFNDGEGCDGSAAGVDQCFMDGGSCASCCGACTITTDIDNYEKTDSCVCYEASTAPSGTFYGTGENDCVFIRADALNRGIYVRNQCLDSGRHGLRGGSAQCSPRRGEEVDTRDGLRARGRDSDLISPTS